MTLLIRTPWEVWWATDDAEAEAVAARLTEELPEVDLRPRGGHGKPPAAVILLVTPHFARQAASGALSLALDRLCAAEGADIEPAMVPVCVRGPWPDVAPADLRAATPFDLQREGEWSTLLSTLRGLVGVAEA